MLIRSTHGYYYANYLRVTDDNGINSHKAVIREEHAPVQVADRIHYCTIQLELSLDTAESRLSFAMCVNIVEHDQEYVFEPFYFKVVALVCIRVAVA